MLRVHPVAEPQARHLGLVRARQVTRHRLRAHAARRTANHRGAPEPQPLLQQPCSLLLLTSSAARLSSTVVSPCSTACHCGGAKRIPCHALPGPCWGHTELRAWQPCCGGEAADAGEGQKRCTRAVRARQADASACAQGASDTACSGVVRRAGALVRAARGATLLLMHGTACCDRAQRPATHRGHVPRRRLARAPQRQGPAGGQQVRARQHGAQGDEARRGAGGRLGGVQQVLSR